MGPLARDLPTEASPWLKRRRCKWHRLPACGIRQIHRFRPSHECYRCIHLFAVVHGPGAHVTAKNLFRKFTQALYRFQISSNPIAAPVFTCTSTKLKVAWAPWPVIFHAFVKFIGFVQAASITVAYIWFAAVHGPGAHATAKNLFRKIAQALYRFQISSNPIAAPVFTCTSTKLVIFETPGLISTVDTPKRRDLITGSAT